MFCYKWVSCGDLLRFNFEKCQSLLVNVYGVKSADSAVCTLNLLSCDARKKEWTFVLSEL